MSGHGAPSGPTAEGETPVLEIRDLSVTFAGRVGLVSGMLGKEGADAKAVDGVDLAVYRG